MTPNDEIPKTISPLELYWALQAIYMSARERGAVNGPIKLSLVKFGIDSPVVFRFQSRLRHNAIKRFVVFGSRASLLAASRTNFLIKIDIKSVIITFLRLR